MTNGENLVTITQAELDDYSDAMLWLNALESAGVDNWSGYDYACDLYHEWKGEEAEAQA